VSELIRVTAKYQSEKTCTGCHFNHGKDDITCHKFDDEKYEDVECYDEETNTHLIFEEIEQEQVKL